MKRLRSMNMMKRRKIERQPFFWFMHQTQMQSYLKPFALGLAPKGQSKKRQVKPNHRTNFPPPRPRSILDCLTNIPISARMALNTEDRSITHRTETIYKHTNTIIREKSLPNELFVLLFKQKEILEHWVQIERKCIYAFRNLVRIWLQRRYGTRLVNTEDPATLAEPLKPILIFDHTSRGLYCFEVSTLQKNIESSLTYADWMAPEPLPPKNPFTNVPFTTGQLVKIFHDLRVYGKHSWVLESFRSCGLNLQRFHVLFQIPLKTFILHEKIRANDPDFLELFDEFVEDEHDYHGLASITDTLTIKWAIRKRHTHRLMQAWIKVFRMKQELEYTYGSDDDVFLVCVRKIHGDTKQLFINSVHKQDMIDLGLERFGIQSNVRIQRRQRQLVVDTTAPTRGDALVTGISLPTVEPPVIIRTSIVPLETFPAPLNVLVPIPLERINRRIVNLLIDETHPHTQEQIFNQEGF